MRKLVFLIIAAVLVFMGCGCGGGGGVSTSDPIITPPTVVSSALYEAIAANTDLPGIISLLEAQPELMRGIPSGHQPPLIYCIIHERYDVLNFILTNHLDDCDIEARDTSTTNPAYAGQTAVHCAISFNKPEVLKQLMVAGASIQATTDAGANPFMQATRHGSLEVMNLLVEEGIKRHFDVTAYVRQKDINGHDALWYYLQNHYPENPEIFAFLARFGLKQT